MARIAYLSWPAQEISGGIKAAFQHVELLLDAGLDAVVATEDGRGPPWFETNAPIVTLDAIGETDILVFPENHEGLLKRFAGRPNPKVVFCQSILHAWRGLGDRDSFGAFGVTHLLCPSHIAMQFCRRRFPDLQLAYTPFYIDETRFVGAPAKKLQIACEPRKRPMEAMFIRDLFRASFPQFRNLDWLLIQKATERQVAEVLGRSAVYLSLARIEAHSVTCLEAMACGCIVAGFAGRVGHNDSATAANGFWAAEDDVESCTDQLARAVQVAVDQREPYRAMVAQARQTAHAYRKEEVARLLLAAWRAILPELGR